MYKVTNKAVNDFNSPEGVKIDFKKNFLNSDADRRQLLDIARVLKISVPRNSKGNILWTEIQSRVKKALAINWVAQETFTTRLPKDEIEGIDIKKEGIKTTDQSRFYELYAAVNMGLHNLMPGETQEIVDDIDIINQLINSGVGTRIQIATADGQAVYDGVEVSYSSPVVKVDINGKKYEAHDEVKRVGNSYHPEKLNILHAKKK